MRKIFAAIRGLFKKEEQAPVEVLEEVDPELERKRALWERGNLPYGM